MPRGGGVSTNPESEVGIEAKGKVPASASSVVGGAVLVVDAEIGMRSFLQRHLGKSYALVESAADVVAAESLRERCHFDLIILDANLPGESGTAWMSRLREQGVTSDVIFMSDHADADLVIEALRAGASDFLLKPFRIEQIRSAVERCLIRQRSGQERDQRGSQPRVSEFYALEGLVGRCQVIKDICETIKRIAPMPSTILISGESGTGKELAARSIHTLSKRRGPFVPINCGAISADLLESELFGHAKGAFTGAHQARDGLCLYAHEGTLFLDEVGEMPLSLQAKLLRFLEERKVRPVGHNRETAVDVRVIAASNRDLVEEVASGRFRSDLFYRLNVVALHLPPLRERCDDIDRLASHFSDSLSSELGLPALELDEAELARLRAYSWPGNIRELRNIIERSLLLGIRPSDAVVAVTQGSEEDSNHNRLPGEVTRLAEVERCHILAVLKRSGGNKSEAARRLDISRKTLERKLKAWTEDESDDAGAIEDRRSLF